MGYNKKLPSTFTFGNGAALWRNPSRPVRFILLVGVARLFRQAERGACLCRTCRSPSVSISKACKEKLVVQLRANRMLPKVKQMAIFLVWDAFGHPGADANRFVALYCCERGSCRRYCYCLKEGSKDTHFVRQKPSKAIAFFMISNVLIASENPQAPWKRKMQLRILF